MLQSLASTGLMERRTWQDLDLFFIQNNRKGQLSLTDSKYILFHLTVNVSSCQKALQSLLYLDLLSTL